MIVEGDGENGRNDDGDELEKMDDTTIQDFYGVPMRLQLVGFLREEKKFDNFPDLIAQIHADIEDARLSLDCQPYQSCRNDSFFRQISPAWIGNGGGDQRASWESGFMKPFLDSMRSKGGDRE